MNYYFDVWKKYAIFSGRSRRAEYWFFVLFNLIAAIILGIIGALIHIPALIALYDLAIIIPSLAVGVRRLHDIGRTGWWLLIGFIPLIGAIVLIVFACTDSQPGDNMYGSNPKGVSGSGGPMGPGAPMTTPTTPTTSAPNTTPIV